MSVIERLRAVIEPLIQYDDDGDERDIMPRLPLALEWSPLADRPEWRATRIVEIDILAAPFSAGHGIRRMWKAVQADMRKAITLDAEEMLWLKKFPGQA